MPSRVIQVNGEDRSYMEMFKWVGLTIIADLPVTVVPVGVLSSGLPVGVQIVAPEWQDNLALEVASMLEALHPGSRVLAPPGYESAVRSRM